MLEDWSAISVHIKRLGAAVPAVDEGVDRAAQVLHAGDGARPVNTQAPASTWNIRRS
jgi:hypothetical protein